MTLRKRIAIECAGIKLMFPMSHHELSSAQKFDRLWPSLQNDYLSRADALIAALQKGEQP